MRGVIHGDRAEVAAAWRLAVRPRTTDLWFPHAPVLLSPDRVTLACGTAIPGLALGEPALLPEEDELGGERELRPQGLGSNVCR